MTVFVPSLTSIYVYKRIIVTKIANKTIVPIVIQSLILSFEVTGIAIMILIIVSEIVRKL
jgi:hypothetical protein